MTQHIRRIGAGFWFYILAALAIVVSIYSTISGQVHASDVTSQQRRDLQCIQQWADAYSSRATYINRYLLPRNDAQAAFEVAVSEQKPVAVLNRLRSRFITLSLRYDKAQKSHPLPPSPTFLCAQKDGVTLPSISTTATSPPGAPLSRQAPTRTSSTAPTPTPRNASQHTPSTATPTPSTHQHTPPAQNPRTPRASPQPSRRPVRSHSAQPTRTPPPTIRPSSSPTTPLVPGLLCSIVNTPLLCTEAP